jgi:ABC-type transporter Mla subunit MlaD
MQLRRNEFLTGLFFMGSVAVIVLTLILLGAPGLFRPLVSYKIYFDNAAGIKLGAPVLLAGRKIGQVQRLYSPVSREEDRRAQEAAAQVRPPEPGATPSNDTRPKFEVRIDVQVDKSALVYRDAHARLISLGLLGEMAIDITQGTETSGRARNGEMYAGERASDFTEAAAKLVDVIQPVAKEATNAMKELEGTANNLSHITDKNSSLNQALDHFKVFSQQMVDLTAPDGKLNSSLANIENISEQLSANDNLKVTLTNFRESSDKLKSLMTQLGPQFAESGKNLAEFTNTIKTQPWRLVYPSTKKYPSPSPAPSSETITVRKSGRSKASTRDSDR